MKINGKAYCLFEQSGTFRDAFKRAGIPAVCVDIDNQDGQTDHIVDLFEAIEQAYDGKPSFLDRITPDDFVMAFFPCIHFCDLATKYYDLTSVNYRTYSHRQKAEYAIKKSNEMVRFYQLLLKLVTIAETKKIRLVVENPFFGATLMKTLFRNPDFIDYDRAKGGDFFKKPTAYWFYNCNPEPGPLVIKINKKNRKKILNTKRSESSGACSLDRSRISSTYADNFVRCKILGNDCTEKLENQQLTLL